jgi:hypothetical protein
LARAPTGELAIGPVQHPDDAVASKVCALYAQAQSRDYVPKWADAIES